MLNHHQILVRSVFLLILTCLLTGCQGASDRTSDSHLDHEMTPVPILVAQTHPWKRAQEIANEVPNSDVIVGHGDAMLPMYQDGTVLVVQKLELEHLRPGMTVVFYEEGEVGYEFRARLLVKKIMNETWELTGSTVNSQNSMQQMSQENYIGTVVAALNRATEEQKIVQREFLVNTTNLNCTIQCHIAGETHPRVVPGLKPKITTFDFREDR